MELQILRVGGKGKEITLLHRIFKFRNPLENLNRTRFLNEKLSKFCEEIVGAIEIKS